MAYITDAKHLDKEVIDRLHHIPTLIINALRIKDHLSHMSLKEALDVIQQIEPQQAYLIHMSHDMGKECDAKLLLPDNVQFAHDCQIIKI